MSTCKDCICFDPVHYWCVMGSVHTPEDTACDYYLEAPDAGEVGPEE